MREKRLNVRLTEEAYEELARLARKQGKGISELVRDSLTLGQWFYRTTQEQGGQVPVQRPGEDHPKQVVIAG